MITKQAVAVGFIKVGGGGDLLIELIKKDSLLWI